ncbi:Uncharacterised protein [Streptococcus pneumoniae]|nr:Uncharacterised protein [Streptococcus pneumoniae]
MSRFFVWNRRYSKMKQEQGQIDQDRQIDF